MGRSTEKSKATAQPERSREINRYVSQQLRRLRIERGMSQEQVGKLLERFLGGAWNFRAVSRAEICDGTYIKRWNVDDVYALSAAFDVPIAYFLPDERHPLRSTHRRARSG